MLQDSGPGALQGVFLAKCLFLLLLPSRRGLVSHSQAFRVRFPELLTGADGARAALRLRSFRPRGPGSTWPRLGHWAWTRAAPGLAPRLVPSHRAALWPTVAWVRGLGLQPHAGALPVRREHRSREPPFRGPSQPPPGGPGPKLAIPSPASPLSLGPAPQLTGPLGASAGSTFPHTQGGGHGHPSLSRFQALAARRSLSS